MTFVSGSNYRTAQAEAIYPPLGKFVEVTGGRVHYLQEGSGPHVVLVHGASGNMRDFTFDLLGRLTDRYTVTVFDRPGLGYTDRVPGVAKGATATEGDSPMDQASMLREAATIIGITNPVVVGHSLGGIVAYAWALEGLHTENLVNAKAVVSLAGVAMPWPGDLGWHYSHNGSAFGGAVTIPLMSAIVSRAYVRNQVGDIFAPHAPPSGYAEYVGVGLALRPDSFRANIRQINTLRPHVVEMAKSYPELFLPIEIVHGTADETVPINIHTSEIAKIVSSANVVALDGVGHMPHHTHPEAVLQAINRAIIRAGL